MSNKILWTIDHDTGYSHKAFLIGHCNGFRFVETFNKNSWFSFGLMFSKWKITRIFKIIYKETYEQ